MTKTVYCLLGEMCHTYTFQSSTSDSVGSTIAFLF